MNLDGYEISDEDPLVYILGATFDGGSKVTHLGGPNWMRPTADAAGERIGIIWAHLRADDGRMCFGGVKWRGEGALWTLHSLDPLHVEPSLLCRACGAHGFIRDGRWVQA